MSTSPKCTSCPNSANYYWLMSLNAFKHNTSFSGHNAHEQESWMYLFLYVIARDGD